MKKITLMLFVTLLAGLQIVMAQNMRVTGTVTATADGSPLNGVSVVVKGTTVGSVTNNSGAYAINAPANGTLIFNFVGMVSQEVAINGRSFINVELANDAIDVDEVVVTAFGGVVKKSSVSGSISSVKGDALNNQPVQSFDQAMAGKIAGVQITNSSGLLADGVSIRVRGTNSISLSSQPLVVIDGVPVTETSNLNVFNDGNGTRFNPMATINPNDIESIEVLKDAAAAALYGSRAANGVLLITTKRGKDGKATISYNGYVGVSTAARQPKLLNGQDFIDISNEKASNRWGAGTVIAAWDKDKTETNWTDLVFRNGLTQNHAVSASGGTARSSYYASADWANQQGVVIGNNMERGSIRANIDVQATDWFKVGMSTNYSKTFMQGVLSDGYLAGVTISAYNAPPTTPEMLNGDYNLTSNGLLGAGPNKYSYNNVNTFLNAFYHPTATIARQRNENTAERVLANVYGELTPIKNLKITSKISIDNLSNFEDQYSHPTISGLGMNYNGLVQDNTVNISQWNWQNYANYNFKIKDHSITLMGGIEYQFRKYKDIYAMAGDFVFDTYQDILDGLYVEQGSGGTMNSRGFSSYFGRFNYNFKDKYLLEASFRADAYSGFGISNRRGYFPGISGAWRIKQEQFMKDVTFMDDLKLRASWGIVGNSDVSPYASRTLFGGGQYGDINGVSMNQVGNSALKWEQVEKIDVGVDASFFGSRLNVSFDYWLTNIKDMLLKAPIIHTAGIPGSSILTNIGKMRNQGIELQINTTNITTKNVTWTSTVNFTTVKNEVLQLAGSDILGTNSAIVGQPIGVWRVYQYAGVDPQTGRAGYYDKDNKIKYYNPDYAVANADKWKYADGSNASPLGTSDIRVMDGKSGTPKWYGNFDNTVRYKNFDLTLGLQFAGGHYILNATNAGLMTMLMNNNIERIKDRWTTPGQITDIPKLYHGDRTSLPTNTTLWLEKADFLRVRDLTIGYNLPKSILNAIGITNARIYARGSNLAVLTGYTGTDPEISTDRNENISVGWDNRSVPYPRTFTFGVNISF